MNSTSPDRTTLPLPIDVHAKRTLLSLTYKEIYILFPLFQIGLTGGIALIGFVSNIVNIIVFYRQGIMAHSSTVILTVMAISDLCMCLLKIIQAGIAVKYLYFTNFYTMTYNIMTVSILVCGRPFNLFIQVGCGLMVLLTLERAVSVVFPFKVKLVFTPKRCVGIIIAMFFGMFILYIPELFSHTLKWSIDRILFVENAFLTGSFAKGLAIVNILVLRGMSVLSVTICNITILWKVKASKKFRSSKANASIPSRTGTEGNVSESKETKVSAKSSKEVQLLRMISVISLVFGICYTLCFVHVILFAFIWKVGVNVSGMIENISWAAISTVLLLNSSVNVIIYYTMSSRFREEIQQLCWKKRS